jgi:cytoskeleton protein RodZ
MTEAPQLQTASRRSAGETLRYHREARNLTVADIATQMRLDPRIVEALEADDYERLPAALYVRGYLRGYAKILKLDPAGLLQLYESAVPQEEPAIVPEVKRPAQRRSTDRPVRLFTYLVAATIVLLVVAWWKGNHSVNDYLPSAAAEDPGLPPPRLPYPVTVVKHPDTPFYRAPAEEIAALEPAAAEITAGTTPGATVAPAGDAAAVPAAATGPDRVHFEFSADSWVEVVDARGNRLYTGLVRAGDSLDVGGEAPLDVLLGYAPGVSLDFNGKPFDPAPYSRSGVARFTLARDDLAGGN